MLPVNQTDDDTNPVSFRRTAFQWRHIGAILLLLACALGLGLSLPNRPMPPFVTVLPPDHSIPPPPLRMPDRWIPMHWGWLWKLRYAVLGKPASANLGTTLFRFHELQTPQLQQLFAGRAPFLFTNGVRAWMIADAEVKSLTPGLQLHATESRRSRISLGFGVLATMSTGGGPPFQGVPMAAGNTLTCAVIKRGDGIELNARFVCTEIVTNAPARIPNGAETVRLHTNLMLVARMEIPRGQSVFLYDTNRVPDPNGGVGILILQKFQ